MRTTIRTKMRIIFNKFRWTLVALILIIFFSWWLAQNAQADDELKNEIATAIFAGGCFWCMEPPFDKLEGVISTVSGYTGGHTDNPTYKQVSSNTTGHYEALQVTYDASKISYESLLNVFWHNIDPLDAKGQFCDKGESYRTAIFFNSDEQKKKAQSSKNILADSQYFNDNIETVIEEASRFYPAEEYHQDYYQKNPLKYKYYRFACGRDARLEELWKDLAGAGGALIPSAK